MNLKLDRITAPEGFLALEGEWEALLSRSPQNGFFLTFEYLFAWWEVYGADYELTILTARREDGSLAGIAPLMVGRGDGAARRHLRHLSFIGGLNDTLSEYQDFITAPEAIAEASQLFCAEIFGPLAPRWDILHMPITLQGSGSMAELERFAGTAGCKVKHLNEHTCRYMAIAGTWDDYVGTLPSSHIRRALRSKWKRLHNDHAVRVLEGGIDMTVAAAMDIVVALNHGRWGEEGQAFQTQKFETFHRLLAERLHAKGWLSMPMLEIDGTIAAARYDFVYAGKLWSFQGGWKAEFAPQSVGLMMFAASAQWALARGIREYDFLAGDLRYKQEISNAARTAVDIEVVNPASLRARAFHLIRSAHHAIARRPAA
ncbi:MAG: GNAT family N-acetyltransferase [Verrucomicrobiales bacterium]